MGDMEGGLTSSLAQLVLDDEIMTSIKRVRRGFDVDQDSLALEVIRNVIDNKDENFFAEMHTVRYLRGGEVIIPRLARRQRWDEWEIAGRPDVLQLAAQKANELLSNYSAVPLSEEQARALVELEKVQGS
jgi:trimethylamine--corrinoid protein Co-methyltransferase